MMGKKGLSCGNNDRDVLAGVVAEVALQKKSMIISLRKQYN
jgi:hypothetical protein